jgi:predicted aspartyl protease
MSSFAPALLPLALMFAGPAQDVVPPPVDPDAPTIALAEVEARMTVPVQVAGAGPYRFIIDTGAERTVIARELAATLRLPAGPMVNVTAMSGTSRVATADIARIAIAGMPEIGRIIAPALEQTHLGAQGLLGIDTLRAHRVVIDFEHDTMAVTPSMRRSRLDRAEPGEIVVRAKSLLGQLIVTDARFGDKAIRVVLDTGSPVTVGNGALQRLVARQTGRLRPLELTSATGGKVQAQYAQVDKVKVGGVEFVGLPIAFSDVPPFRRFGLDKRPAMLLGMDALKFFRRVQIDFPNREVRFLMPRPEKMRRGG